MTNQVDQLLENAGYEAVIGLEVHVQLATASKIFSSDANDFNAAPNQNVSVVSLGHPGTLPVLNDAVLGFAVKMGLACGCKINQENHFARKNYFYPDLPKGYQTTQDKAPICLGGKVELFGEKLGQAYASLHHIHLEDDAGKSIHEEGDSTLIDLNRAGTPLIEIVTEPCMGNSTQAAAFLQEIRRLVRYVGISGGNMENGELRCDANVSIMPIGSKTLGNKVEVKNMNSINNVRKAIDHEITRQLKLKGNDEVIISETRTFDAATGTTAGMRFKETMNDYRYFPDPDLPPMVLEDSYLNKLKSQLPALPGDLRHRFRSVYQLSDYDIALLTEEKETALYFDALCTKTGHFKAAANWFNGPIRGLLNEKQVSLHKSGLDHARVATLIEMVEEGQLSFSMASQKVLPELLVSDETAAEIAGRLNLIISDDKDALIKIVKEVLLSLPDKVKAYQKGKKGLIGLFMGETMKKSGGNVAPKVVQQLLIDELNKK